MLALLKKINETGTPEAVEALLTTGAVEYLIGAEWVTYDGGGMCRKVGFGEGRYDMDISKITQCRVAEPVVDSDPQPEPRRGMFG